MNGLEGTIFDAMLGFGSHAGLMEYNARVNKKLMDYQTFLQQRQQERLLSKQIPLQVGSMKSAGLNPAMVGGLSSPVSSPIASASVGSGSSPYNSNIATNILAGKEIQQMDANIKMTEAQSNYYDSLSRKTSNEADILDNDLMYYFRQKETELEMLFNQSKSAEAGTALVYAQRDEIGQNIENLIEAVKKIKSETILNEQFAKLNEKQIKWFDKKMEAEINNLFASAKSNLSNSGYIDGKDEREAKKLYSEIFNLNSQSSMFRSESNFKKANERLLDFNYRMAEKYGEINQWIDMGTKIIDSAAGAVNAVKGLPIVPYTSQ